MNDQSNLLSKLAYFPISLFAMVMGLTGLALDSYRLSTGLPLGWILSFLSLGFFLAYFGAYILKVINHREAVIKEWKHPVKISFFCAISISLLLLTAAFLPIHTGFSKILWIIGTAGQFVLSLATIHFWMKQTHYEIPQSTPAWFIPAVGNIIVPVAGVAHGMVELSWFFFAWGFLFWGILLTIMVYRLIFYPPLPDQILPTLFVMLAPPSIGFVSYINLVGELDILGRLMYYWAAVFFFLLVMRIPQLIKLKFGLPWWAYSFPMTAFCAATSIMAEKLNSAFLNETAKGLFVITFVIIVFLFVRTMIGFAKGQILKPD